MLIHATNLMSIFSDVSSGHISKYVQNLVKENVGVL